MHKDTQKKRKKPHKAGQLPKHLEHINMRAAGIDIGSASHFVAVPEGSDEHSVREFSSFTSDLYELANWLEKCGVETVAMESTGVYWIPLYELLESRGFEVKLVDARHVKNVSGRKTDVLDCQWTATTYLWITQWSFSPRRIYLCSAYLFTAKRNAGSRSSLSYTAHAESIKC